MTMRNRTLREALLGSALAAAVGLGGGALAQTAQPAAPGNNVPGTQAQQVNPSPMPPGSRAGDALGMGATVGGNAGTGNGGPARAQQVNPSPMPPGSRADSAPGMNPTGHATQGAATGAVEGGNRNMTTQGTPSGYPTGSPQTMGPGLGTSANTLQGTGPVTAQGATNPDRGIPGGTGAQAPTAQPDVQRGTAPAPGATPGANQAQPHTPGMTQGGTTGTTTPSTGAAGGGTAPPAVTTQHTEPRSAAAPVAGANSFTEGQARARIGDAGFADVQGLRLDDQGIWRGRAMRNGQQTGVALDYQGNVVATQ